MVNPPPVSTDVAAKTRRSPVTGLSRMSPCRSTFSPCDSMDVLRACSNGARGEMGIARKFAAAHAATCVRLSELGLGVVRLRFGVRRRRGLGRRPRPGRRACTVLAKLADASLAPDLPAQVVELRAVDVADRGDLDLVDLRRVQRERPLDADAERLLADRERLARAASLPLQDDALEDLNPLALPLDPLEVPAHSVPRLELRNPVAQLCALEAVDDVAHRRGRRSGRGKMLADVDPLRATLDLEDASDQVSARDEPVEPRVATRLAVVTEQQELVLRETAAAEALRVSPARDDVRLLEPATVDEDVAGALGPPLARQPHDALDEDPARTAPDAGARRRPEDGDVAAARPHRTAVRVDCDEVNRLAFAAERRACAVQRRFHRRAGDAETARIPVGAAARGDDCHRRERQRPPHQWNEMRLGGQ